MTSRPKLVYAHGFEGRPDGMKAQHLKERLGFDLVAPEMHRLGWSFQDHVRTVLAALDETPDATYIVGSSMGGFSTAVALAQRPHRQINCILMAPAVGIHSAWATTLGVDGMRAWAENGVLPYQHAGVGRAVQLPYALWSECRDAAGVVLRHPTVIIHGRFDDVVPLTNSEGLAACSPGVKALLTAEDGHRLSNSLGLITEALGRF